MSRSPAAYGLALRLARREVARRPWRTLLVALLVALPVGGMTVAVVMFRTNTLSATEEWELSNGQADAMMLSSPMDESSIAIAPPAGSMISDERSAYSRVLRTTDGKRSRGRVTDLDVDAPVTQGIVTLRQGRAPDAPGEVALSPGVADDLDVGPGDTLELERPAGQTARVVGIVQLQAYLDEPIVLVAPGAPLLGADADTMRQFVDVPDAALVGWLGEVDTAMLRGEGWVDVAPALRDQLTAGAYFDDDDDSSDTAVRWSWIVGGVVLTVVGIVIASAFAAGARRQLTTLGQLAANGAGPKVLRRVLFFQGTWTGIVGAVLGLGIGAGALAIGHRYLDRIFDRDVGGYDVRPTDVVPAVLIGIAAATIAALVPARTTSRIPVLAALAGRRPLAQVPRWVTVSGIVSIAAGLALFGLAVMGATGTSGGDGDSAIWALTAIAGGMAVLLGACAVAPAYVSVLDGVSNRLTGPWRFAARSLARQRTRTGAVVSGVCAAGALAIGASALVLGATEADAASRRAERYNEIHIVREQIDVLDGNTEAYRITPLPPPAALIEDFQRAVPGLDVIQLTAVDVGELETRTGVLADDAMFDVYGLSDAHRHALEETGALSLAWGTDEVGRGATTEILDGNGRTLFVAAAANESDYSTGMLPHLILTPATVAELGLQTAPGPVVLRNEDDFTSAQRTAIEDVADDFYLDETDAGGTFDRIGPPEISTGIGTYSPPGGPDPAVLEALLSGIALVFALFVVAVSLALASAENADERDVLAVVGASPSTTRRTSAHKAVILTVMGALLAIPVGFLPVVVFTSADAATGNDPLLVFPWRTTALLLVAVPVITALATMAASTVTLWTRPVRVSTMTFD